MSHPVLKAEMLTDVGVVRDHNEDAAHVDPSLHFFVVADGMGGHAAGEIASEMAVESVRDSLTGAKEDVTKFASNPTEDGRKATVDLLESAVRSAHQAVYERGVREPDKEGMGTTLDVVLIAGPEAFIAHVGDSRTYLIRDGKAAQITTDHTVAEVLVIEGKLSLEEAQISPLRTILVNAIGVAPDVGVEMAHVQLRQGDTLLLCSDGLHDYFPAEQELADLVTDGSQAEALGQMIGLAKERGGHDNITAVIVNVVECPEPVEKPATTDFSDGVPAPVSRDDTLPVDVGSDAPETDSSADPNADLGTRSTEPVIVVPPRNAASDGSDEATEATKNGQAGDEDASEPGKDADKSPGSADKSENDASS